MVIDVQSYFVKKSPSDLPQKIAQHISKSKYDFVAFSIFQNQDNSNWERSLHWSRCKNEEDMKLAPELESFAKKDNTFTKNSYSIFKNKDFENTLKHQQIDRVEVCGIDTDACVLATAFDAFDHDYEVKVLFNLSYSSDNLDEESRKIITRNMQSKNS